MFKKDARKVYAVTLFLTVACFAWRQPTSALTGAVWMTLHVVTFAAWFWSVAIDWVATHDAETRREDQALWGDQPVPEDWS